MLNKHDSLRGGGKKLRDLSRGVGWGVQGAETPGFHVLLT